MVGIPFFVRSSDSSSCVLMGCVVRMSMMAFVKSGIFKGQLFPYYAIGVWSKATRRFANRIFLHNIA